MAYEQILADVKDSILTITLNRPEKLNAFTGKMMYEMIESFELASKDDDVRAIVVTGAGRAFCAGADLSSGADTFDFNARTDRPDRQAGSGGAIDWSDERCATAAAA
jgi:enoyl-CoA hydratase/carnithine racemase